ncbi:unnamed protein product [Caenorhabditis nigoni]
MLNHAAILRTIVPIMNYCICDSEIAPTIPKIRKTAARRRRPTENLSIHLQRLHKPRREARIAGHPPPPCRPAPLLVIPTVERGRASAPPPRTF